MTGSEIRQKFLKYFEERGHTVVASSSLVPHNDPTLLFTNAGMNQFKDLFLGKETRSYTRSATCQKVVRAGGKHNDLENVGRTARHHTFFEMLGNFSFGDYFKTDAIKYGWEFLTKELGLPQERMFVTIYNDDDESFEIWNKVVGVPAEKIIRKGEKDNFWSMGDTGPCGPCSEIHIDQGPSVGCGRPECDHECDCDRHLELWNLVFMQFNRQADGTMHPLPKPSIDTGMGLERIATVVQKVNSNYDTDLFRPILQYIARLAGKTYGASERDDVSIRVIADHSRSTTFLVADGVLPSNEGRGYVLRRIMRRAMRHGRMLGLEGIFFHKVCEFVVNFMQGHYIELSDKRSYISKVVEAEENAFGRTLTQGLKIIGEMFETHAAKKVIPGDDMFRLYDTYGFPVDLLKDIAEDNGYALDEAGFEKQMNEQIERAKKSWQGGTADTADDIFKSMTGKVTSTFVGYDSLSCDAQVIVMTENGRAIQKADAGQVIDIVLNRTPFYPEGGGQAGDTGVIEATGAQVRVTGTVKVNDIIVHRAVVEAGTLITGAGAMAHVDATKRRATEKNHTATHLLHKALQMVLGDHVRQAGSQVTPDRLRFDFNHFSPLSAEEYERIELLVNVQIQANSPVTKSVMRMDEAVKTGAMALFGEKYGETVRVVEVPGFSRELCGGCHVGYSGEIGFFKIISESSVAAGVRRIEAITGMQAVNHLVKTDRIMRDLSARLKCSADALPERIDELNAVMKEKDREIRTLSDRLNASKAGEVMEQVREVNGVKVLAVRMDGATVDVLRTFVDTARDKIGSGAVVVGAETDGKVIFICGVTKDATAKVKAGAVVKYVAQMTGGNGGGRDDMAQAGGKDASKIDDALNGVYDFIAGL